MLGLLGRYLYVLADSHFVVLNLRIATFLPAYESKCMHVIAASVEISHPSERKKNRRWQFRTKWIMSLIMEL